MRNASLRDGAGRAIAGALILTLTFSLTVGSLSARADEVTVQNDEQTVSASTTSPVVDASTTTPVAGTQQASSTDQSTAASENPTTSQAVQADPLMVASNTVTVTPTNLQGWSFHRFDSSNAENTGQATSTFVRDINGRGSVKLSTPSDEILIDRTDAPVRVGSVTASYQSKRLSGSSTAAPSYIFGIDKDGNPSTTNDILYAYYEPVYNGGSNYDAWNTWNINQSSKLWSFDAVSAGKGGANGANLFTFQDVKAAYPNATVGEYTINLGSGNDGWSVLVDNVATPTTTYDFEPNPIQTYTVTPSNTQGWTEHEYGTGASATYVDNPQAFGNGALQLSTPDASGEVLYDLVESPTQVEDINVSYTSKRVSGASSTAPAYIFGIDKDGNPSTTNDTIYAYYEPVYNVPGANYDNFNTWTVNQSSKLWSFDAVSAGKGGANGANLFTFQDVKAAYPNATVNEYTLNVGSGTPGAAALVDSATTPNAIYNFDRDAVATNGSGGGGGRRSGGGSGVTSPTTDTSSSAGTTQPTQGSTGQVLGASTYQFTVNLHVGSKGTDVTELQKILIAAGYLNIPAPTGYFGLLTRAAAIKYQLAHNIFPPAGFVGPITRAVLNAGIAPSATTTTTTSSTTSSH